MPQWEYHAIYLSEIPHKVRELDALNDAGDAGWELVGITGNNIAYLKRRREEQSEPVARPWRKSVASAVK
jgi:hypothetical protein